MRERLDVLRAAIERAGVDAFFSLSPPANQYLTGFLGSTSGVIVTAEQALFFCDFRYVEQAHEQVRGWEIAEIQGNLGARLGERLHSLGIAKTAFDPTVTSVHDLTTVSDAAGGIFLPEPEMAAALRRIKSREEVALIREASELAESVLGDLVADLREGTTERELAARFEYEFKRRGAAGAAFDTIVLFGARTSLPHGQPGDAVLAPGDVVLLDLGCRKAGYCSDLTRTYVFGRMPGTWFEEIYEITLRAQVAALQAARPGMRCRELDAVARDVISASGYGERFGHGLGHGVGIEVHESPRLNSESDTILEAGMVVTIEPGIYLSGQGGVRIEDLVVLTDEGCDRLTDSSKELHVL